MRGFKAKVKAAFVSESFSARRVLVELFSTKRIRMIVFCVLVKVMSYKNKVTPEISKSTQVIFMNTFFDSFGAMKEPITKERIVAPAPMPKRIQTCEVNSPLIICVVKSIEFRMIQSRDRVALNLFLSFNSWSA